MSSRLEKRFAKGLSFVGSFTYGRSLDLQNPALEIHEVIETRLVSHPSPKPPGVAAS